MSDNKEPIIIKEESGDTISIFLTPEKTPVAYARRLQELTSSGMAKEDAELDLIRFPIELELFYDFDRGLFGVESEALDNIEIFNPYTGEQIPNEN